MKVGIAYDGVTWDAAKTRKELHNKVAYASFESAKRKALFLTVLTRKQ